MLSDSRRGLDTGYHPETARRNSVAHSAKSHRPVVDHGFRDGPTTSKRQRIDQVSAVIPESAARLFMSTWP